MCFVQLICLSLLCLVPIVLGVETAADGAKITGFTFDQVKKQPYLFYAKQYDICVKPDEFEMLTETDKRESKCKGAPLMITWVQKFILSNHSKNMGGLLCLSRKSFVFRFLNRKLIVKNGKKRVFEIYSEEVCDGGGCCASR